ncbi:MFS transporter [Legionella pneumophila]|uniref:Proline/betaine transport protein like protein n=1 Tax=Legionella pneumophila subsp. pascullei TaxID=91890 RepID=A0AAX2ISB8_LEGPN|nr:MFS transporter [Legionella pneumophila]AMP88607.1 MFS transporter [Legionella pneumophila subsp. pascullei]AMP91516.1 MFS transporter [Legionella pneumophila subsp. pascullei]AMP94503.1 MFS transporter [Legionella pneumophila subsp. pascullei]SQG89305.1 proline/betaine transport protein like protein [Legionella pneumophila subsp. pascullei]VEH04445.1 proline/betaine transport protein like protein [Legionella pneumophila subsp. pascullei]
MKQNTKHSIIAGLYGNALEWYDFLLYASFAPVFAEIFFPSKIHFVSLIATFSLFAIGFIMRPIGGLLLGHYADHVGRRKALILSMSVMTISTALIAVLPDFNSWGIIAPILFSVLRLIQGLAVGGELPGSTTYLIEHMFQNRRGLAGSLVLSSAFLGIFIGALTASIFSTLFTGDSLLNWGWRYAYLLGGILGILGIYLRIKSFESPTFLKDKHTTKLPAKVVFTQFKQQLFLSVIITSILAMANYVLIAYVTTFLVKSEYFLLKDALLINLIALALLTVLIPLMGFLSDAVGRKPIFLIGLFSLSILIFPFFWLLLSGSWWIALCCELLLALVLAPINATVPTIIAEMFPTSVRASGISISYNIGQALFGGTMPLVAFTLIELSNNKMAPAWYLFLWILIVIPITISIRESYQKELI